MKKLSIVFILFLTVSINVFSLNRDIFNMDISAGFGILNGSVGEYVFDNRNKNTDNMMSRLNWDVFMVPYFEGDITFNIVKYLYIDVAGRAGIPCPSKVMQDYDWLNSTPPTDFSEWTNDDPTELTNYSKHENEIVHYYKVSAKLGGNIPILGKATLTPFIGYKYDFLDMLASNGYTKYKWHSFEEKSLSGKGIKYCQESNFFIVGLNLDLNLIKNFPISTYFQVVPGVGQLTALDVHYYGKDVFLDVYKPVFELEWKVSAAYNFSKHHNLCFSAFIQYMPLHKGMTGKGDLQPNGKLPNNFVGSLNAKGGAERFLFSFSLGYEFKL